MKKFRYCFYYDKNKMRCVHNNNVLQQKKYPKCPYPETKQKKCKYFK